MDFLTALHISKTGLTVQRTAMNIIAANLANLHTTQTPQGGPYRRKIAVIQTAPLDSFESIFDARKKDLAGAKVEDITEAETPPRQVYEPGHPHADPQGYVSYPDISLVKETTHMMIARRSYEANVAAISATKRMALKALELGR
jgi:flagellar basal-body rod protein FlgC